MRSKHFISNIVSFTFLMHLFRESLTTSHFMCATYYGYCFHPDSSLCLSPINDTAKHRLCSNRSITKKERKKKEKGKKKAGRKWIPLKLTDRLSTHMFQMFSVLHKRFYNTSTVNSSSNPRLSHSGVEKCVQNGSAGTTNLTYSDFRFSVYTRP